MEQIKISYTVVDTWTLKVPKKMVSFLKYLKVLKLKNLLIGELNISIRLIETILKQTIHVWIKNELAK